MTPEMPYRGRWLAFKTVPHRDAAGNVKPWEYVSRMGSGRAVSVCARLENPARIVLVKQWRAPMNAYTLELPAGLVEEGDGIEETALRELREETGFTGRIVRAGEPVCSSPGMTDETVVWVDVAVTGREAAAPEPDERIETLLVPLSELGEEIARQAAAGVAVEGKLYGFWRGLCSR